MTENIPADEDVIKYRLIGALVWILLLLLFVPGWYADPVSQGEKALVENEQNESIAITTYRLPEGVQPESVKQEVLQAAREQYLKQNQHRPATQVNQMPSSQARDSEQSSGQAKKYMVRLISFFEIEKADKFIQDAKKHGYKVELKEYDVSKNGKKQIVYQARTEKYNSLDKALKAKRNLDKIFHLRGSRIKEVTQESKN